ncbi:hypothetical protein B0H13DRAFT_1853176 [Mycena leptocephala]|nr:hypothetical protein B0H13DRAFT_1853176 [Mycena leptocephala]
MSTLNSSSLGVDVPQRLLGPDMNDAGDHVAPQVDSFLPAVSIRPVRSPVPSPSDAMSFFTEFSATFIAVFFLSPRAQPNVLDVPGVASSSTRPSARAAQSQDVDLIFRGPTSEALFGESPARKSTDAYLTRHAVKDAFLIFMDFDHYRMHLTPRTRYIFDLILGSPTSKRVGGVVVFHPYSAAADMIESEEGQRCCGSPGRVAIGVMMVQMGKGRFRQEGKNVLVLVLLVSTVCTFEATWLLTMGSQNFGWGVWLSQVEEKTRAWDIYQYTAGRQLEVRPEACSWPPHGGKLGSVFGIDGHHPIPPPGGSLGSNGRSPEQNCTAFEGRFAHCCTKRAVAGLAVVDVINNGDGIDPEANHSFGLRTSILSFLKYTGAGDEIRTKSLAVRSRKLTTMKGKKCLEGNEKATEATSSR